MKNAPSKKNIEPVFKELLKLYPNAKTELEYDDPFQLLIAVILSAQCTDARVNQTTPALFAKYPTPKALGSAKQEDVEVLVKSCGFFRSKAKAIISTASDLQDKFNGSVPADLDSLITLAGVGRKTASVVLSQAFDMPAIAVDTHVKRVANRLGWVKSEDPEKIEFALRDLLPEKHWAAVNTTLILHGRRVCNARKPDCENCSLSKSCHFFLSGAKVAPIKRKKKSATKAKAAKKKSKKKKPVRKVKRSNI